MKKSLIALAVMAAAGAASAQSSVQLYGVADVVLHKDEGASTALTSGGVGSSYFGLKGSEDLGGGLKAIFKLEQGYKLDTGAQAAAGDAFSRESYVGLAGGFGEVQVGQVWTSYDDATGNYGVFDANVLAPGKQLFRGYNDTANNGVKYNTPTYAGFSGSVSYALDEAANSKKDIASASVKYANGPVAVAVAFQNDKADAKYTLVNGSYNLGVVKLLGTYQRAKTLAGDKETGYSFGVDYPVASNLVLSAAYGSAKFDNESDRRNGFSLAAAYLLSKRTTAYAGLFNGNDAAAAAGAPDSRVGVGIRHTF